MMVWLGNNPNRMPANQHKDSPMKTYANAAELITAIRTALDKYLAEFADIAEADKHRRAVPDGKTPAEHLAYQLGWTGLLLQWERDEQAGQTVHTPAEGYKWNDLGGLYQQFYRQYGSLTLQEAQARLREQAAQICTWLETLSEQELFEPNQRRWANNQAKWPIWKWVHINTVAPFTNFRVHIRKWKKQNLHD